MEKKCCDKCREWAGAGIYKSVYDCYDPSCECHKSYEQGYEDGSEME